MITPARATEILTDADNPNKEIWMSAVTPENHSNRNAWVKVGAFRLNGVETVNGNIILKTIELGTNGKEANMSPDAAFETRIEAMTHGIESLCKGLLK